MAWVTRLGAVAPLSTCGEAADLANVVVEKAARKHNTTRNDKRREADRIVGILNIKNFICCVTAYFYRELPQCSFGILKADNGSG
jgi:hypothetical protein